VLTADSMNYRLMSGGPWYTPDNQRQLNFWKQFARTPNPKNS